MTRFAIIGAGITGLACASELHRRGQSFVLYESEATVGGHASVMQVPIRDENGEETTVPVDTGFQVFNMVTYPNMLEWFERHGVEIEPSDMSFACSSITPTLEMEWGSDGLPAVFAQGSNLTNPKFYKMLLEIRRFEREARAWLAEAEAATATAEQVAAADSLMLGEWLDARRFSDYFSDYYLLPMCASIWSIPNGTAREMPARFLLAFFRNHCLFQVLDRPPWLTIKGRTQDGYVQKVIEPFRDSIRVNARVASLTRRAGGGLVVTTADGRADEFDDVIVCTHTPEAVEMLLRSGGGGGGGGGDDAVVSGERLATLRAITYEASRIFLHRDTDWMPQRRATWSSWNFIVRPASANDGGANVDKQKVCVTYWINRLQNIKTADDDAPILVTLNATERPKHIVYEWVASHPIPSIPSQHAVRRLRDQQHQMPDTEHVWFAGAYMGAGFHEDGFKAGREVAALVLKRVAAQMGMAPIPSSLSSSSTAAAKKALTLSLSASSSSSPAASSSVPASPALTSTTSASSIAIAQAAGWEPLPYPKRFHLTVVEAIARSCVTAMLERSFRRGRLQICESGGAVFVFGDDDTKFPHLSITVVRPAFYVRVAANGELGFSEAYLAGDYTCSDVRQFLAIAANTHDDSIAETMWKRMVSFATNTVGSLLARLHVPTLEVPTAFLEKITTTIYDELDWGDHDISASSTTTTAHTVTVAEVDDDDDDDDAEGIRQRVAVARAVVRTSEPLAA